MSSECVLSECVDSISYFLSVSSECVKESCLSVSTQAMSPQCVVKVFQECVDSNYAFRQRRPSVSCSSVSTQAVSSQCVVMASFNILVRVCRLKPCRLSVSPKCVAVLQPRPAPLSGVFFFGAQSHHRQPPDPPVSAACQGRSAAVPTCVTSRQGTPADQPALLLPLPRAPPRSSWTQTLRIFQRNHVSVPCTVNQR